MQYSALLSLVGAGKPLDWHIHAGCHPDLADAFNDSCRRFRMALSTVPIVYNRQKTLFGNSPILLDGWLRFAETCSEENTHPPYWSREWGNCVYICQVLLQQSVPRC
jgi:hypothetical protein